MPVMITLSLWLNVVVLVPVCWGLASNAHWARTSYGADAPARRILLSVYGALGVVSLLGLLWPDPRGVAALLLLQVLYKVSTPFTVGTWAHPVVVSNLAIAAIHAGTLVTIGLASR